MGEDWIKIEKKTPRKQEVLAISEALGIPRQYALGLCVDFWVWCDDNLEDGRSALSVSLSTINTEVVRFSGFGEAIRDAGWLVQNDQGTFVPNYDRHMGENAKKRAKTLERLHKHRRKNTPDDPSNRSASSASKAFPELEGDKDKELEREEGARAPLPPDAVRKNGQLFDETGIPHQNALAALPGAGDRRPAPKGDRPAGAKPKRAAYTRDKPDPQAAAIFDAYPRHEARRDAEFAITKAIARLAGEKVHGHDGEWPPPDHAAWLLGRALQYAEAWQAADAKRRCFIPYPATWFNQGGYLNDPRTFGDPKGNRQAPGGGEPDDEIKPRV